MAHEPGEVSPSEEGALRPGSRFGTEEDPFELGEELGSGAAARVYTCRRLRTGDQLAAKVINLQRLRLLGDFDTHMVKLNREVQILRELKHPRIVNLHDVYKTRNWIFLVMELVRGGELFDQIVQNRTLNEVEAKYIFRQLLEGIGYMHSKHVIHRDLKPENILIASSTPLQPPLSGKLHDVKIADFGLSKVISEGTSFAKTFVGTPQYWAPEVLNVQRGGGSYTQAADYWSMGAVLFVMLGGRYPFDGKKAPLEEQIRKGDFSMTTAAWQKVSDNAKDVIRGLLRVNPQERMKIEDCMSHPWMSTGTVPYPLSETNGVIVTEISSGGQATGNGPVAFVTQPSTTSEVSGRSGSVDREDSYQDNPQKARSTSGYRGAAVPSLQVGGGLAEPSSGAQEQETIFCLNELLKLQVSIAGSLEMACLAFRHADRELSESISRVFRQARELSTYGAQVVSKYAQVAQQVSQYVLPDLKLAVQEKEPSLAVSLLGMVKGWVVNMKNDGEEIQRRYVGLQESVHSLIQRAQHTKTDADRRLAEAVQVVDAELLAPALSPRTQNFLALGQGLPTEPARVNSIDSQRSTVRGGEGSSASDEPGSTRSAKTAIQQDEKMEGHVTPRARDQRARAALNVPFSMNQWTRKLFEQLSIVGAKGTTTPAAGDAGGDFPMLEGNGTPRGMSKTPRSAVADEEAWKKDVLELLFMAPGVQPYQLPQVEPFSFAPKDRSTAERANSKGRMETMRETPDVVMEGSEVPGRGGPVSRGPVSPAAAVFAPEDVVVRYLGPSTAAATAQSAAEAVTHSSASLLRALRELKRVDEILQGCSAFWANMDGTVEKLAQMKEHTECLVNFAASSKPLRERFEQRLHEYVSFWASLERLCRQYCIDYQASSKRMYDVIREVADAADIIDTAQSARLRMMAMMQQQRRYGQQVD